MDPPIQLLNRLSVDTADEMIFSFMLWKVNNKNQKEALSQQCCNVIGNNVCIGKTYYSQLCSVLGTLVERKAIRRFMSRDGL